MPEMNLEFSKPDLTFMEEVESCRFPVDSFDHRAHLRLAYIYLLQNGNSTAATQCMRNTLIQLLESIGVDPSAKFHETMTEAWIKAVHHFMSITEQASSADEFIDRHPQMLDSSIMLSHYSAEVLFSINARKSFIEPDLQAIPEHDQ